MDRLYTDPGVSRDEADALAGEFMANMLGGSGPEPGPPYTHTLEGPFPPLPDYKPYRIEGAPLPPSLPVLTSADPEPPPGTIVRDRLGRTWELADEDEGGLWWRTDADDDPESWTKIAGNYGPVTVLERGEP